MNLLDEIIKGENKILEFKEQLPSSEKLAKTIISFSNTSGGRVLIGVNKYGEIIGINDIDIFELMDKISSIIHDNCYPNINPEIYTVNINDKIIIVIEVFKGGLIPYYYKKEGKNEGTYIRIGATNRKASFENIIDLERHKRNTTFDEEINYDFNFEELDISPLILAFKKLNKKNSDQKFNKFKVS